MHITYHKLSFYIFTVGKYLHTTFLACNFYPYNVLLAIATNIPVQLMTGFVVRLSHSLV